MKHTLMIAFLFQNVLRGSLTDFFVVAQEPDLESSLRKLQDLFSSQDPGSCLTSDALKNWIERAQSQYFEDCKSQIGWICPLDPEFPSGLMLIGEPCFLLRYLGHLDWQKKTALAVVGTREPHRSSMQWMEENLVGLIKKKDLVLVSGGARGVDQMAHKISLRAQQPTVCFIPSGLRRIYPQSLQDLVGPILSQGGVLFSEYSSSQEMRKFHFLQRNRLIAGLGIATLLVQAGRRSGTLLTARASLDHGKPIFVVPSHPLDVKSHGGLDLLMDGASMVRDEKDLDLLIDSEVIGSTRDSDYLWC